MVPYAGGFVKPLNKIVVSAPAFRESLKYPETGYFYYTILV